VAGEGNGAVGGGVGGGVLVLHVAPSSAGGVVLCIYWPLVVTVLVALSFSFFLYPSLLSFLLIDFNESPRPQAKV